MGQSGRSLTSFGRRVAELQDREPAARLDHERGRARLLATDLVHHEKASAGARARPPARRIAIRLAASLAAALLLASVVLVALPGAPLRFDLGATEPGVVGAWIAAPPAAELPIQFSDGSRLRLGPGGRARVVAVDADGAQIALERGGLDLAVVHRDGARWTVQVGPFQVHVIGTRFRVVWDPVTEELDLALLEGAITVSGPVVGDAHAVHAGERLILSVAKSTLEVGPIDSASVPAPDAAGANGPDPGEPSAAGVNGIAPGDPASSAAGANGIAPGDPAPSAAAVEEGTRDALMPALPAPVHQRPVNGRASPKGPPATLPAPAGARSWRNLALDARYKDALAAAEGEGFDAICASASASDLRALGDAARLGGSSARAGQALAALRTRFPGSPEAASAAFILGRIAQDQGKDDASAVRWFNRYLAEQPGGAFADDAAGRLVEAEDRMGDEDGARRAAERYLAAYPNGSYARYAERVLARGTP